MCTCGRTDDHVIAERRTLDGVLVCAWSNGDVTGVLGMWPRGIGRTKMNATQKRAAQLLLDEVCLYDWSELGDLIKTARRAVVQASVPPLTYLRRAMAGETFKPAGKAVVVARPRRHATHCPCETCNPHRVLPPGTIAGAPRYA